jgi:hypothetical protein
MRFCYRCPEHRNCHGIISAEAGFLSFKPAIFWCDEKRKIRNENDRLERMLKRMIVSRFKVTSRYLQWRNSRKQEIIKIIGLRFYSHSYYPTQVKGTVQNPGL